MKMKQCLKRNLAALLILCVLSLSVSQTAFAAKKTTTVKNLKCGATTSSSINISWSSQSGISGYHVFRASSYDGPYKQIKRIAPGNHAFCNMKLQGGMEYYYRVRSYVIKNGVTVTGKFSKILTARTKGKSRAATVRVRSNIRKHAGTNHPVVATLNAGAKVTVVCAAKDKSGGNWSRVSYTLGNKKYTGYISTNLLSLGQSNKNSGIVTAKSGLRIRRSPSTASGIVTTLVKGTKVTILGQTTGTDGQKWYHISVKKNGRTFKGYAYARYIKLT